MRLRALGLLLVVTLFACNSESSRMKREIVGRWDVYSTELNNIPNGLMQNGWFEFGENGEVKSNIFNDQEARSYVLDEGQLTIGEPENLTLKVSKLENDSLNLEGQLGHYFMRYYLIRKP